MARRITDVNQSQAPTSDYPQGRVINESVPGANDGSVIQEEMLGDIVVFFAKLMADAGVNPNGNPDNETNGYQLMQAFLSRIGQVAIPDGSITTPKIVNGNVTEPKYGTGSVSTRALGDGSVTTPKVADRNVTLAKLQNLSSGRIMGRVSGGTGITEQLTGAQAASILEDNVLSYVPAFAQNFAPKFFVLRNTQTSSASGTLNLGFTIPPGVNKNNVFACSNWVIRNDLQTGFQGGPVFTISNTINIFIQNLASNVSHTFSAVFMYF